MPKRTHEVKGSELFHHKPMDVRVFFELPPQLHVEGVSPVQFKPRILECVELFGTQAEVVRVGMVPQELMHLVFHGPVRLGVGVFMHLDLGARKRIW